MLIVAIRQRPASCERTSRVDQVVGRAGEPLRLRGAGAEGLAEQHAADRQPLLHLRVQVGEMALALGGDRPAHPGDPAGQPDRRRQDDEREQRQPPAQRGHRDRRPDDRGDVRRGRRGGRGDHRLHAADVVGQPRLHLAAAGAGEEAERLPLQVREDRRPQAVHDPLADGGGQPRLDDAEDGGDDGDREHAADGPRQQAHVLRGRASSMTIRTRNGVASETVEDATISAPPRPKLPSVRPEQRCHAAPAHGRPLELGLVGRIGTAAAATALHVVDVDHLLGIRMLRLPHGVVTAWCRYDSPLADDGRRTSATC